MAPAAPLSAIAHFMGDMQTPPRNRRFRDSLEDHPFLESRSSTMRNLLEAARRAADSDATILLTGESGTGKDALARQIHEWSSRRSGPFVAIDCATLAEHLLEDELFGHVRGAFTGAVIDKSGRLELAAGGTVYFAGIADLTPPLQAKFLRFVEERSFERIGGARTISVNARIIAAAAHELESQVATRRFRADLYYRLNVVAFRLPPLRDRAQDIIPLAESILRRLPLNVKRDLNLSREAAGVLAAYRWPGNVRELSSALARASIFAQTDSIMPGDLPESIHHAGSGAFSFATNAVGLRATEREYIMRVLAESPTFEQAAATLGIDVTTLRRKRKRYGIS
jgi:NtrC-family two-component system response regulator AlgB